MMGVTSQPAPRRAARSPPDPLGYDRAEIRAVVAGPPSQGRCHWAAITGAVVSGTGADYLAARGIAVAARASTVGGGRVCRSSRPDNASHQCALLSSPPADPSPPQLPSRETGLRRSG